MKRGDVVVAVFQGDYGKPRPAVVIQGDLFADSDSLLLCQFTSDGYHAVIRRISVLPTTQNGLKVKSQITADKIFAIRRDKIERVIGTLDDNTLNQLNVSLALVVGLVK